MSIFYSRFAKYYDTFYSFKDYKAEVEELHNVIQTQKKTDGERLLDVACGTGGHIQYLRKYYKTWGIDASEEMLDVARSKINQVEFRQADMADFSLGRQFDVITCLFGSINYLVERDSLRKAVRCFSDHTVEGGVVIIEPLFTTETARPGSMGLLCIDEADYKLARVNSTRIEGSVAYLDFHFLLATREGTEHIFDPSPLGIFSRAEIASAMKEAGYRVADDETGLSKEAMYVGVKR